MGASLDIPDDIDRLALFYLLIVRDARRTQGEGGASPPV